MKYRRIQAMKNSLFKEILSKISTLTHDQRIILKDAIEHSSDIDHICDLLQKKIEEDPECPHCHGKSLVTELSPFFKRPIRAFKYFV